MGTVISIMPKVIIEPLGILLLAIIGFYLVNTLFIFYQVVNIISLLKITMKEISFLKDSYQMLI